MNEQELLAMAKGTTKEFSGQAELFQHKSFWNEEPSSKRKLLTKRKTVRRGIFKIRKYIRMDREFPAELKALKELMDEQLNPNLGMSYETFSFRWDIHPNNHLTIITPEKWFIEGGSVDGENGNIKEPTAFTEQE